MSDELVKRLREFAGPRFVKDDVREAADLIDRQAARIAELENAQSSQEGLDSRNLAQLADWLMTDPQTGERLHFAGPLEPDFLRFSRVKMQSKSVGIWTLSARLEEGYLTAAERLDNIKRAARESE